VPATAPFPLFQSPGAPSVARLSPPIFSGEIQPLGREFASQSFVKGTIKNLKTDACEPKLFFCFAFFLFSSLPLLPQRYYVKLRGHKADTVCENYPEALSFLLPKCF
jgi:hypothetical protein